MNVLTDFEFLHYFDNDDKAAKDFINQMAMMVLKENNNDWMYMIMKKKPQLILKSTKHCA